MADADSPTPVRSTISCSCGARWTGLRRAHCAAAGCHATFNSDSAAAMHRKGSFADGTRRCIPPADAGLVSVEQPWGLCWQKPGSDRRFGGES